MTGWLSIWPRPSLGRELHLWHAAVHVKSLVIGRVTFYWMTFGYYCRCMCSLLHRIGLAVGRSLVACQAGLDYRPVCPPVARWKVKSCGTSCKRNIWLLNSHIGIISYWQVYKLSKFHNRRSIEIWFLDHPRAGEFICLSSAIKRQWWPPSINHVSPHEPVGMRCRLFVVRKSSTSYTRSKV